MVTVSREYGICKHRRFPPFFTLQQPYRPLVGRGGRDLSPHIGAQIFTFHGQWLRQRFRSARSILPRVKSTYPDYPSILSWATLRSEISVLAGKQCSLRQLSLRMVQSLRPPLHVEGAPAMAGTGGMLIGVNHYHRPGFNAWWIAMAICAQFPVEIHWGITAAWTYADRFRSATATPLTRWLFRKVAKAYGLTVMPPMPAQSGEEMARAEAVRRILAYVRGTDRAMVGLAPEGGDSPTGALCQPPSGVGRFIALLGAEDLQLLPAGLYESEGRLNLRFGETRPIPRPKGLPDRRDRDTADFVMREIASCLPASLWGEYA
jgi:hypothetical protein